MTLALNLPAHVYGYVDRRYVSAGEIAGFEPAIWFGLTCPLNRAFGLTVLLECGAIYRELPPQAWAFAIDAPEWAIVEAQVWECFGGEAQAIEYRYLREARARSLHHGLDGRYLFTVECGEDGYSREPSQTKAFHFLALDNNRLTILPGDHVLWTDASFTETTPEQPPTWIRRNRKAWRAEA